MKEADQNADFLFGGTFRAVLLPDFEDMAGFSEVLSRQLTTYQLYLWTRSHLATKQKLLN